MMCWLRVTVVLCAVALSGCVGQPPLANAQSSRYALAETLLDAIARRDVQALRALALNEEEFSVEIWPQLPAARPERSLPVSYVWGDLRQKSERALQATLARHGGRRYELIELRFADKGDRYGGYQIYRDPVFLVGEQGIPLELRLTGSIVETNGSWKVFSYVTD